MAERGPVATNSGPLIARASVGQLDVLRALYTSVLVPEAACYRLLFPHLLDQNSESRSPILTACRPYP
jgi:predicted nucleic acid-binding protein